jgi:hypothetical protein
LVIISIKQKTGLDLDRLTRNKGNIWNMNKDQFLSLVVEEILKDAYNKQTEAAYEVTSRRLVEKKDSVVGYHTFGISDFVMRLVHDMYHIHGIKWTHTHSKLGINDYSYFVNKQEKIKEMREVAKKVRVVQIPSKLSKMTQVIDGKWKQFDARMNKEIPQNKRYYRISLIAMYVHYIGKQLPESLEYPKLTRKVTSCKESFLPGIGRHTGLTTLGILMDTAMEVVMRDFADAKTHFRAP